MVENNNINIKWQSILVKGIIGMILISLTLGGYKMAVDNLSSDMKESKENDKTHALKINTLETQYTNIEKWMIRIDEKLDKIPRRQE